MPFVNEETTGGFVPQGQEPINVQVDRDYTDILKTAFDTSNSIGQIADSMALYGSQNGVDNTVDPDFDPFEGEAEQLTGYEDVAYLFDEARNQSEFNFIKSRVDKERAQNEELAAAGVTGVFSTLGAGILDPINLVPFANEGKLLYTLNRAGKVGKMALVGARAGLYAGAASEVIAQNTRLTQTATDSLMNIGASTVLSSTLAGGIGRLSQVSKGTENIESFSQEFSRQAEAYATQRTQADLSVGAAQVPKTTLEQETLSSAANMEKLLKFQDPVLRLSNSPSVEARRTLQDMAEVPLTTKKNEQGIASSVPVESMVAQHDANLDLLNLDIYDLFMTHRKGRKARFGDVAVTGIGDLVRKPTAGRMTFTDFRTEIGKAMARNDQHDIPEVASAAKLYRERVFNPLKDQAIELDLLPPDVTPKTAASYISRLYNREKIIAQRPEFERRIAHWLRSTNQNITENFTHWRKQADIANGVIEEQKARLAELTDEISQVAPQVKKFRERGKALDRDTKILRTEAGKARTRAKNAQVREESLTPAERDAEFSKALRDVRYGIPKGRRPQSIVELLRSKNISQKDSRGKSQQLTTFGLKDDGGELRQLVDKNPKLSRIINNKNGHQIDDFGETLQRLGYFDHRPTTAEIINAIEDEISTGSKRYPQSEEGFQAYEDYVTGLADELERRGLDINKLPDEVIREKLTRAADELQDYTIRDENIGSYSGQTDNQITASNGGQVLASLKYSVFEGRPSIQMIEVSKGAQRKGIASQLITELQSKFPDTQIEWGMLTEQGEKLKKSLKIKTIPNKEVQGKKSRIKELEAQLEQLNSKFREKAEPTPERIEELSKANDELVDIEAEIDDLKADLIINGDDDSLDIIVGPKSKGDGIKADTAANRAKAREAALGARRATKDAEAIEAKLTKKEEELASITESKSITTEQLRALQAQADDAKHIMDINTKKGDYFGKKAEDVHYIAGASDDDLLYIAQDITDGLIGTQHGRIAYEGVPVTRGPLNERTLLIPDEMIEDFLDRDIFRVARHYNQTMAPDIELTKKFRQANMKDKIEDIREDFRLQRYNAAKEAGLDPDNIDGIGELPEALQRQLTKINKAEKETLRDIEGIRDRLRGTYGIPDNPEALSSRAFRVAKGLNYLRLLGGMTLSALPDVARPIMVHGVGRAFKDGLVPMVKNFRRFKLQAEEAKLAGTALDMINNDRALAISNLDNAWMHTSKFERGLTALQDNFKFVSLMAPWNSAAKQFASLLSQNRSIEMIQALAKGGEIKPAEITRLAKHGIDKPMAERMAKQIKKHSTNDDGIWWANTQAWDDRDAVDVYRAALKQEVDKIIVTPGQDKPLFMSREAGSVIMQFKTFALASTQRMLLSGLQQRDMAAANGFMLSTFLGMAAYWSKTDEDRLSDDPAKWIVEGIDRSGSMAWFMEVNNMMEKITGMGINPMLGQQRATRYASRNAAEAMFGPTYGTVFGTMIPLIAGVSSGEMKAKDIHKIRQMMPYQNIFYIRKILDQLEEGTSSGLGLE